MKKNKTSFNFILFVSLLSFISFVGVLHAQREDDVKLASGYQWSAKETSSDISVKVNVLKNFYLYKDYTSVELKNADGKGIAPVSVPKAIEHTDAFGTKQYIYPPGTWKWTFNTPEASTYSVNVKYQGCSKDPFACYPPKTFTKTITANKSAIPKLGTEKYSLFKKKQIYSTGIIEPAMSTVGGRGYLKSLIQKGGFWIFVVAFLGGLFSVFTPCILPLLPITMAVLGAGKDVKKTQAVIRSFLYVGGIVITFAVLAVIAALTGRAFGGSVLSNPIILMIFTVFFILMSFSLLGLYDFRLPNSWSSALNKVGGGSVVGAFLMGLVAGFIAIPCTGPVLATLLGIAAATGNVFFGSALLFVYAVGFGIPFFIVGVGLVRAPKSGGYMDVIKSLLGITILLLSLYLLTIVFPSLNLFLSVPSSTAKIIAIILIVIGVLFGAFHGDGHSLNKTIKYLKVIGAVMVAFGIVWIVKLPVGQIYEKLVWSSNIKGSFTKANTINKPLILDFTADWCTACKELEAVTFSNKKVEQELTDNWVLARVDATRSSEKLEELVKKYNVLGYPTVIIFSPDGKELFKISGFIPPDKFLEILNKYK